MGYLDQQIWFGRSGPDGRDWTGAFGFHKFEQLSPEPFVVWLDLDNFGTNQDTPQDRAQADQSIKSVVESCLAAGATVYRHRPFGDEFVLRLGQGSRTALEQLAGQPGRSFTGVLADFGTAPCGLLELDTLAQTCDRLKRDGLRGQISQIRLSLYE